jgi:hypothetical protein
MPAMTPFDRAEPDEELDVEKPDDAFVTVFSAVLEV